MFALLLLPFIYIGICDGMSHVLPPVDYKAVSQEQTTTVIPEAKSGDQMQKPTQVPQPIPADKSPV